MRTTLTAALALAFFGVAACGGGDQGNAQQSAQQSGQQQAAAQQQGGESGGQQEAGELTMPDWMQVDEANETVTIELVAGSNSSNNNWNYNGYHANNNARIVVPQGYEVTIDFDNQDDLSPHSVGVDSQVGDYPPTFQSVEPVFDGAVSSGATSMSEATQPGQSESFTFTASEAGDYALVCYLPGHATAGMWVHFRVSAEGEAGVQEL